MRKLAAIGRRKDTLDNGHNLANVSPSTGRTQLVTVLTSRAQQSAPQPERADARPSGVYGRDPNQPYDHDDIDDDGFFESLPALRKDPAIELETSDLREVYTPRQRSVVPEKRLADLAESLIKKRDSLLTHTRPLEAAASKGVLTAQQLQQAVIGLAQEELYDFVSIEFRKAKRAQAQKVIDLGNGTVLPQLARVINYHTEKKSLDAATLQTLHTTYRALAQKLATIKASATGELTGPLDIAVPTDISDAIKILKQLGYYLGNETVVIAVDELERQRLEQAPINTLHYAKQRLLDHMAMHSNKVIADNREKQAQVKAGTLTAAVYEDPMGGKWQELKLKVTAINQVLAQVKGQSDQLQFAAALELYRAQPVIEQLNRDLARLKISSKEDLAARRATITYLTQHGAKRLAALSLDECQTLSLEDIHITADDEIAALAEVLTFMREHQQRNRQGHLFHELTQFLGKVKDRQMSLKLYHLASAKGVFLRDPQFSQSKPPEQMTAGHKKAVYGLAAELTYRLLQNPSARAVLFESAFATMPHTTDIAINRAIRRELLHEVQKLEAAIKAIWRTLSVSLGKLADATLAAADHHPTRTDAIREFALNGLSSAEKRIFHCILREKARKSCPVDAMHRFVRKIRKHVDNNPGNRIGILKAAIAKVAPHERDTFWRLYRDGPDAPKMRADTEVFGINQLVTQQTTPLPVSLKPSNISQLPPLKTPPAPSIKTTFQEISRAVVIRLPQTTKSRWTTLAAAAALTGAVGLGTTPISAISHPGDNTLNAIGVSATIDPDHLPAAMPMIRTSISSIYMGRAASGRPRAIHLQQTSTINGAYSSPATVIANTTVPGIDTIMPFAHARVLYFPEEITVETPANLHSVLYGYMQRGIFKQAYPNYQVGPLDQSIVLANLAGRARYIQEHMKTGDKISFAINQAGKVVITGWQRGAFSLLRGEPVELATNRLPNLGRFRQAPVQASPIVGMTKIAPPPTSAEARHWANFAPQLKEYATTFDGTKIPPTHTITRATIQPTTMWGKIKSFWTKLWS
ncbi:MAG: hypothetical protein HY817_01250 [Candidatus Abawacabacteria bacterium]|nr:hypothetical protein [Candidatus Abawacabacteria bacterium]